MSTIPVDFQECPWTADGVRDVHFTRLDLRHAAVAAGRNWRYRGITTAERAHNQARVHDIISTVDLRSGGAACVSQFYRALGSTVRATKSFALGNAFCALIADKELRLPWLVDVEALNPRYRVRFRGNRRADFIGRSPAGRWFAFEAKGRSTEPNEAELTDWKEQARSIRRINGRPPERKIVSATYACADRAIQAIWRDPPADEGRDIEFSEQDFFRAYYKPIFGLIQNANRVEIVGQQRLAVLSDLHMSVGVHSEVRELLAQNDSRAMGGFAESRFESNARLRGAGANVSVFADGVIVKMDPLVALSAESK